MSDKLIYLAGPYSYNPDKAFELHMSYAAALMNKDFMVFSPILHNHHLAKAHDLPTDYVFWQHLNRGMVIKSDELWIIWEAGWKESKGTQYEIHIAEEFSKPIKFVSLFKGLHVCDFVRIV